MARTTKVLGFSVPPEVAQAFEAMAKREHRIKSELFREMFRLCQHDRTRQSEVDDAWVMQVIREAKAAPMTEAQWLQEGEALAHYGAQRAEAPGYEALDEEGIERLIHEP